MPEFATPQTLTPGDEGEDVVLLQQFLVGLELDPGPGSEGVFDELTANQVVAFKASRGLPEDPTVDPDTWAAFFEAVGPLPTADMPSIDLGEFPAISQVISFGQTGDIDGYIAASVDLEA